MEWEEYRALTQTLLDFYELSPEKREQIMLMMDGLKWRKNESQTS